MSASGALHLAAVAGLLAAGGWADGWALRAFTPPPGYSAPQLTLRMPAAASSQDAPADRALPVEFATHQPREASRESLDAQPTSVSRTSLDPPNAATSVAAEFSEPDEAGMAQTGDDEVFVVAPQGTVRLAAGSEHASARPSTAELSNQVQPPRRSSTDAQVATQSGPRTESPALSPALSTVARPVDPKHRSQNASHDTATAHSSASRASERRSGVNATLPEKVFSPQPDYPADELAAGHEGRVVLRVTVNARGLVESTVVQRSSGFPALDEAAQTAVRRWRFKLPDAAGGDPRATQEVAIPIRFEIQR